MDYNEYTHRSKNPNCKFYVLGFIFCLESNRVILINKLRPDWQKDYNNGIGGKVEENETYIQAMVRETLEESNLRIGGIEWEWFCTMRSKAELDPWEVICYTTDISSMQFEGATTMEEERINKWQLGNITTVNKHLLGNIPWLVGMALDKIVNDSFEPVIIDYTGLSLPLNLTK